jgi:KipI family sensor histidine kinase inhibitor
MLYSKPVHLPLGDLYLTVEFGDELSIEQNFLVIALDRALHARALPGVTETIPTNRSLTIVYDPAVIALDTLSAAIRELEEGLGELDEIPSRLVSIPIWYDDPWSRECALAHGVGSNIEYLAELNGISVDDVIAIHSGTEHWVAAVGFQPATYQAIALGASMTLTAPKYERPRTQTPARILCIAGRLTSFYPVESPGGYQLLGRTPIELYDPEQRNPVFRDGPVLPRVSDRHRYVPIGETEYQQIRSRVEAGTYEYAVEPGTFSLSRFLDRQASQDATR